MIIRLKRRNPEEIAAQSAKFKKANKELKKTIYKRKESKWEELRQDDNKYLWGVGYKVEDASTYPAL